MYKGKALRTDDRVEIEGETIVTKNPITLLGFVDAESGKVTQEKHDLNGKVITDKIFVFPRGIGSTVGPYVLLNLVKNGLGPKAIINRESDQGTVSGCSVAKIPMAYGFEEDPTEFLKTGDKVKLVLENGISTIEKM
ncbi:MAG: DUF126 domain-containing protein [Candidatus Heimdallarchaeota archaeon]|nr:DUF126 domain-containing protein [Candidatus Heimdallarchaeota archaeon]